MIAFEAGLFGLGALFIMGPRLGGPAEHHGIMLAAAAGILFGVCNLGVKALTGVVGDGGAIGVILSPWTWVALSASAAAFYASARSLQDGDAVPVIAITGTAANIATIAGGIIVFGDPLPNDALGIALQALAFVLVIVASALTPAPVRARARRRARRRPRPPPRSSAAASTRAARARTRRARGRARPTSRARPSAASPRARRTPRARAWPAGDEQPRRTRSRARIMSARADRVQLRRRAPLPQYSSRTKSCVSSATSVRGSLVLVAVGPQADVPGRLAALEGDVRPGAVAREALQQPDQHLRALPAGSSRSASSRGTSTGRRRGCRRSCRGRRSCAGADREALAHRAPDSSALRRRECGTAARGTAHGRRAPVRLRRHDGDPRRSLP